MAGIGDYESAPNAAPASWVAAGLHGFGDSVLSLVPEGFEAYARIFHPAWNYEPEAVAVDPADGVNWPSDQVNPAPARD